MPAQTENQMDNAFSKQVKVTNKDGIHARPSVKIVEVANKFESEIFISKDGLRVNGKSILEILTLAACYGSQLTVEGIGKDAQEAVEAITNLLGTEFHFPQSEKG